MTNMDKLYASVAANGPVCVGLDTEFSYLPASSIFPRRDIFREVDYPDHVFWGFKWERRLGPKQNSSLMAVVKTGGNSFRY